MINPFTNKSADILKRSAEHKSKFTKLRDSLIGINEEAMVEAGKISAKIQAMEADVKSLSVESGINDTVIKNIDKILGN